MDAVDEILNQEGSFLDVLRKEFKDEEFDALVIEGLHSATRDLTNKEAKAFWDDLNENEARAWQRLTKVWANIFTIEGRKN